MLYFSYILNWLYSGAGLIILGLITVLLLSGNDGIELTHKWRNKCLKVGLCLSVILFVVGLVLPSWQAVFLEENLNAAFDPKVIETVVFSTRFGFVWLIQQSLSLLVVLSFILRLFFIKTFGYRQLLIFIGLSVLSLLLAGMFKSHTAALEPIWPGLLGNSLHLIAAGTWFGGLPALFLLLRSSGGNTDKTNCVVVARTLKRFSILATVMVIIIMLSGVFLGALQVSRWSELFSTTYGQLLLIKLLLFVLMLACAAVIRCKYMPSLGKQSLSVASSWAVSKWVGFEVSVGCVVLAIASALKETTPAAHEELVVWPFSFRLSMAATWDENPDIRMQVTIGLYLAIVAIALMAYLIYKGENLKKTIILGVGISVAGLIVGLPPLSIKAYPDTYTNSTVPYIAVSIANGESLFNQHCVSCHGIGGKGDGVLAGTLSKPPADLTAPHAAQHTVGDMFWWLMHGMGDDKAMPAFKSILDEEEVWDLINYLHAFSDGVSDNQLRPQIVPNRPSFGAPDFYYSTINNSGNLKDFRNEKSVLLVLFSWPESSERLKQLKNNYNIVKNNNAEIIAIAMNGSVSVPKEFKNHLPFVMITEEANAIVRSFAQYRGGDSNNKNIPMHMEFIVDRFGYLRSRWVPEHDVGIWDDFYFLGRQLEVLAEEDEVLSPPDEHVH